MIMLESVSTNDNFFDPIWNGRTGQILLINKDDEIIKEVVGNIQRLREIIQEYKKERNKEGLYWECRVYLPRSNKHGVTLRGIMMREIDA